MSAHEFHRLGCYCKRAPCICARWEGQLANDGLQALDYEHDRLPFVLTGNRGSGKLPTEVRASNRAEAEDALAKRQTVQQTHAFVNLFQRRAWELHAGGACITAIALQLGTSRNRAWRAIRDVRRDFAARESGAAMRRLARQCDRATLELVCGLLRRALTAPAEVSAAIESFEALAMIAEPADTEAWA
jgi:hypothetical protein